MSLTLQDFLWAFSKEPLLLIMLIFTLINLLLLTRLSLRRRKVLKEDVTSPLVIISEEDQILIDVASVVEENRPVQVNGKVDNWIQVDEERVNSGVKTVSYSEEQDTCKYCFIFKDLSSVVCPNCGRRLNGTTQDG
jgi:hypothetical protein